MGGPCCRCTYIQTCWCRNAGLASAAPTRRPAGVWGASIRPGRQSGHVAQAEAAAAEAHLPGRSGSGGGAQMGMRQGLRNIPYVRQVQSAAPFRMGTPGCSPATAPSDMRVPKAGGRGTPRRPGRPGPEARALCSVCLDMAATSVDKECSRSQCWVGALPGVACMPGTIARMPGEACPPRRRRPQRQPGPQDGPTQACKK
jgi:hypothetical protein